MPKIMDPILPMLLLLGSWATILVGRILAHVLSTEKQAAGYLVVRSRSAVQKSKAVSSVPDPRWPKKSSKRATRNEDRAHTPGVALMLRIWAPNLGPCLLLGGFEVWAPTSKVVYTCYLRISNKGPILV